MMKIHNSEDVEHIDIGTEEMEKEPYLNGVKEIFRKYGDKNAGK